MSALKQQVCNVCIQLTSTYYLHTINKTDYVHIQSTKTQCSHMTNKHVMVTYYQQTRKVRIQPTNTLFWHTINKQVLFIYNKQTRNVHII